MSRTTTTEKLTLAQIRELLDRRLADREADRKRLEQLKRRNARAIRHAEAVRAILRRA